MKEGSRWRLLQKHTCVDELLKFPPTAATSTCCTCVVLCYIVYGSHVWNSPYNNIRYIRVVMCVNAMWMCHHWFMHIETHPCLGRSHTRASTTVMMGIIRNTFDVHMALQIFLTPPPKMGRSPRDNNFAILAIIVWAGIPTRPRWFLSWKAQRISQFVKNSKLDTSPQNAFWWGQRSH